MAIKKIEIRPKGTGDYADILYPKTSADMVIDEATGKSVASHLGENAIDAHNASNISIIDSTNKFTATDVEGALSELFQFANDGKTAVANAVTAKGVSASPSDTFSALAAKIGQISTGKKVASGTGTAVGTDAVISGLGFTPKIVIFMQQSTQERLWTYVHSSYFTRGFAFNKIWIGWNSGSSIITSGGLASDPDAINPNSDGFSAKVLNSNATYKWFASE